MHHCSQEDCINCFGGVYAYAKNGGCYDLNGVYGGNCTDCSMNSMTIKNDTHNAQNNLRERGQGSHTHTLNDVGFLTNQIGAHRHTTTSNLSGLTGKAGLWSNTGYPSGGDYFDSDEYNFTTSGGSHVGHRNFRSQNGNGGTQNNLRTREGQFINRRTGNPVSANMPYHTHQGQAMAGAVHSNRPHDKYDRITGIKVFLSYQ